jgi:hypothetical protein
MRNSSLLRLGIKQVKRSIVGILGYHGYQLSAIINPSPPDDALFLRFTPNPNANFTVALVGTSREGLYGYGKATPLLYFPKFGHALAKRGITLMAYRDPAHALRNIANHDPTRTAFVFVYNEDFQRDHLQSFGELTCHTGFRFYNAPSAGEILGNKSLTNAIFAKAGICVPPLVCGEATSKVFSNAQIGTHAVTTILDVGQPLDAGRYNTRFIDTVHEYGGNSYHVALRALAVTGTMLSAYVRLRPAGEAEASVHASDTPQDAALISYFHETVVESNRTRLIELCEQIGEVLGPGFYAHDILPRRETGELYVCESGFKFDDQDIREALWPIGSDLPFLMDHFTVRIADLAAEEIAKQCFGDELSIRSPHPQARVSAAVR